MNVQKLVSLFLAYSMMLISFYMPICAVYPEEDILSSLDEFTLEELLNMPVTTAAGREQNYIEVTNAMTVITREDIERSGARQIQELFYRVPGMHIRRLDGHLFGMDIRRNPTGEAVAIDMLVLVDGVVVFNPIINGTIWTSLPVSIDEIERIEVIRGAGGVLYSANGVLGVVNIITKSAKDSGNYVSFEGGSQTYGAASGGFGVQPFKDVDLFIRSFYQFDRDNGYRKKGTSRNFHDDLRRHVFGFRADMDFSPDTKLTALFKRNDHDITSGGISGFNTQLRQHYSDTHVSTSLSHRHNEYYDFTVDSWFKHTEASFFATNDVIIDSLDFKTQHNLSFDFLGKNILSAGTELLMNWSDNEPNVTVTSKDSQRIASVFVQEEYRPIESLIFTAGFRMDDNTNVQHQRAAWQPRFSAMYLPDKNQSIRFVVSRMIRQTSFGEKDVFAVIIPHPTIPNVSLLTSRGDEDINPETYWSYEVGYRGLLLEDKLNVDALVFLTDINELVSLYSPSETLPTTVDFTNNGRLKMYGFETALEYELYNNLFLLADYSFVNFDVDADFDSNGLQRIDKKTFQHIIGFGGRYTWGNFNFDAYVKYFSETDHIANIIVSGSGDRSLEDFFTSMFRVSYEFKIPGRQGMDGEVEIVARDVHGSRHIEDVRDYFVSPQLWGGVKIKF